MSSAVAIVAAACEYPEAHTPQDLWATAVHGRRCFRRMPPQRLALSDYDPALGLADSIGRLEVGLLENYRFDRERFRVPQAAFKSTDWSHWLALDVADRAWSSLSAPSLEGLKDSTAVIVANTLTGEFSRAGLMRYRWPYVRRLLKAAAAKKLFGDNGFPADDDAWLRELEANYKAPFPAPDEDSLAGGLSNTIAGRIANHFGLRGGAYTVDGACASSLVAVVSACDRLASGDIACALVGAVDLSLDPFELVGFARNGALATELMSVFDARSSGFWPGEGCGFVMLATVAEAQRRGWPVLAWLRGAAMSSDGEGGLTRPSAEGQLLAARRAWCNAGLDPAQADYFEAHGTGTPTGDPVELEGLAALIGAVPSHPVPVGSIKANIGHTKAAAGMAGLLKAIAICRDRLIPATTGCQQPLDLLSGEVGLRVNVRSQAQRLSHDRPATVGVNSFGFGGINCHVVVQGAGAHAAPDALSPPLHASRQLDGELFLLEADSAQNLDQRLLQLERRARSLSRAQLVDLAAHLSTATADRTAQDALGWRACLVACTPQQLEVVAVEARSSLQGRGEASRHIDERFAWSAPALQRPCVVLLFPGQGLPQRLRPGPWTPAFHELAEMAANAEILARQDLGDTEVVQRLQAEVALAGLALLRAFEIEPTAVLGHSFGELPALHVAGRITSDDLRRLANARGACMRVGAPDGSMLAVEMSHTEALALAMEFDVELACENGWSRQVLAGATKDIAAAAAACAFRGASHQTLPTRHAFHSRLMRAAQPLFERELNAVLATRHLTRLPLQPIMVSSVSGSALAADENISALLLRQFVEPVKFVQALASLPEPDLVIEVGASASLVALVDAVLPGRAVSLQVFGESMAPALLALGSVWVLGAHIGCRALFEGRLLRPCSLDDKPLFLTNPCGVEGLGAAAAELAPTRANPPSSVALALELVLSPAAVGSESAMAALRVVLADLTGLPMAGVAADTRLLSGLHLNSIRARHAVALAARRLGLSSLPFDLARLADATLAEVAAHLEALRSTVTETDDELPLGVEPWLRVLNHNWVDAGAAFDRWTTAVPVTLDDELAPLDAGTRMLLQADPAAGFAILVLPVQASDAVGLKLLRCVQQFAASTGGLLVLQGAQLANGFVQSAAAELPQRRLCVFQYQRLDATTLRLALSEYARIDRGYSEARLRGDLIQRRLSTVAPLPPRSRPWRPGPQDVVVISGGARGIGAATALGLAHRHGCRVALIGRSDATDAAVAASLDALKAAGSEARYFSADLADPAQVRSTMAAIEASMGKASALIHAAGINRPQSIADLSEAELRATVACKVGALAHLLDSVPSGQWRLVVGFGSIIGEYGLAGEAHYALANEWLCSALARHAERASDCSVLAVCWSAWRETGMAARIEGVLDALQRAGTRPLETDEALAALWRLIDAAPVGPVIVSSRHGRVITNEERALLQTHRYLESPRVHYPGIELIADAHLCSDGDRYLQDHRPFGVPVLPLVCAIEAMCSAAQCLSGRSEAPVVEALQVGSAVVAALGERFALRVAALVDADGSVRAEIRSQTTDFEVLHFSARLHWRRRKLSAWPAPPQCRAGPTAAELLYQGLLFHGPRFQRLGRVDALGARHCSVHTRAGLRADWVGPLLPQRFCAGDPGLRDAVLHGLQLCIPHQLVLPVAAARVELGRLEPAQIYRIDARQTASDGRRFVFDVQVCDRRGEVIEAWTGLELALAPSGQSVCAVQSLAAPLLGPMIERLAVEFLGAQRAQAGVVVGAPAKRASARALAQALGRRVALRRRSDGGLLIDGLHASTSHAGAITVALTDIAGPVAVDLQFTPSHAPDIWRLMLGELRMRWALRLSERESLPVQQARMAAWTLSECLLKLGRADWPLDAEPGCTVVSARTGFVFLFDCGGLRLAFTTLNLVGSPGTAALAIAVQGHDHVATLPQINSTLKSLDTA